VKDYFTSNRTGGSPYIQNNFSNSFVMSILVIGVSIHDKETVCQTLTNSTEIERSISTNLIPILERERTSFLIIAPSDIRELECVVLRRVKLILVVWNVDSPWTLQCAKSILSHACERIGKSFQFLVIGLVSNKSEPKTNLLTLNPLSTNSISNIRSRIEDALFDFQYPVGLIDVAKN